MLELDHLVIAAATLAEGAAWCERVFGIAPAAGGKHAFMGTHNLLFSVASARFPTAYAEIIAIDPEGIAPPQPRWFGLDAPALQRALASGPQLVHWVARTVDISATTAALRAAGIDPGHATAAERRTPRGLLRWQIGLRADGQRLFGGALPTLIQWGDAHPCDTLPDGGVALECLLLSGLSAAAHAALGETEGVTLSRVAANEASLAAAPLRARLRSPRGEVWLAATRLADPASAA